MARVLMKGNEAIAEAAVRAGVDAFFGYPITPQNEVPNTSPASCPSAVLLICRARASWLAPICCWVLLQPAAVS